METFDLYGFEDPDLESARTMVEAALKVRFTERDNTFGVYYRLRPGEELWTLQRNWDPEAEKPLPGYPPRMSVLLHIEHTRRGREIEAVLVKKVPDIRLVARRTFDGCP